MFRIEHSRHSITIQMQWTQPTLLTMEPSLQQLAHQTRLSNASTARNGSRSIRLSCIKGTAYTITKKMRRSKTNTMLRQSSHQEKVHFYILWAMQPILKMLSRRDLRHSSSSARSTTKLLLIPLIFTICRIHRLVLSMQARYSNG